jgi:hypothetical protein
MFKNIKLSYDFSKLLDANSGMHNKYTMQISGFLK